MSEHYAYTDEEGIFLVRLARMSLETYLKNQQKIQVPLETPLKLKSNSGVFVTLNIYRQNVERFDLRGCIGRPYPHQPLAEAVIEAAIDSGVHDPRFPSVSPAELGDIIVEVTALTPPVEIKVNSPEGRLNAIEIGKDGIIIQDNKGSRGALFLPQVPVEWNWTKEEYLSRLCEKAGLPQHIWKDVHITRLSKFQGEIFSETSPNGDVIRKIL
ncbi:MAG: TIGR00296 family protein [Candidatus Lokiarchaeota archaeon]|nr:TIGR00296 family protein [Candidatus Lokiarchaeota archaeon]